MSKEKLQLPQTKFSMRANLPMREPKILEKWEKSKIFNKAQNEEENSNI